ncbi:hypothetical protein HanRHA438_Chr13g0580341 [Helianthus annuus]|nr:hypothetical protein HanRHA438_Chr13g0580341 [Helianthus annuus]
MKDILVNFIQSSPFFSLYLQNPPSSTFSSLSISLITILHCDFCHQSMIQTPNQRVLQLF